jgi:predicted N-acetyltransferase YhbS
MKRLNVRPPFRGEKLGLLLVQEIITQARECGYRRLRFGHPPEHDAGCGGALSTI